MDLPPIEAGEPLGLPQVAGRAAKGAVALGVRHVGVTAVNLIGSVVLARMLSPADFGVYAVVAFMVAVLNSLGDGGLGVSLVRQANPPSEIDIRSVFGAQQAIVGVTAVLGFAAAPVIVSGLGFDRELIILAWLLIGALVVTSFQVVPMIRLERSLAFGRIGVSNFAEAVTFNVVAIALATSGAGPFSFGAAAVAQAFVGVAILSWFSPWRPGWAWRPDLVRERLRFGIPFQGIVVVSLLKDSITPILIGILLGATDVGYVKWSQSLAAYLLLALMVLDRIYFPVFARLQDRPADLRRLVEAVVRMTNTLVAPFAVALVLYADPVTRLVYGEKWVPALGIFYWLCAANLVVPTASVMFSVLNALGRSRTAFKYAVVWMALTWGAGLPLILAFGAVGYGIANVIVQTTNYWLVRSANRSVQARIWSSAVRPWALVVPIALVFVALRAAVPVESVAMLAGQTALFLTAFVVMMAVVDRATLRSLQQLLRKEIA